MCERTDQPALWGCDEKPWPESAESAGEPVKPAPRKRKVRHLHADEVDAIQAALDLAREVGASMPPTRLDGTLRVGAREKVATQLAIARQADLLKPGESVWAIMRRVADTPPPSRGPTKP